ncbi:hypothetical protein [Phaeovulum sp. NW3]|uniref:hypothetical protein n=1 Tax=Phaeovulum sp. NW3 TaxID=2934933 RepID=UPI00202143AD|nr:hypothetical protein [Phaeovulum sp. NW3]MCL7463876.1 hypothetical protein [Phaeovulum sp. NW3]
MRRLLARLGLVSDPATGDVLATRLAALAGAKSHRAPRQAQPSPFRARARTMAGRTL